MAGDWIKVEIATPDKSEVFAIAEDLDIDPDAAFGKLMRVWMWFDQQTDNGVAPLVSKRVIDRKVALNGFCDAIIKCGWMIVEDENIVLPNFDRHNGESAKKRSDAARRKSKSRALATSVTKKCDKKKTISRPLRKYIFERDEEKCVYCGFEKNNKQAFGEYVGATLSLDHVIPESKGGEASKENLVTSCTVCNQSKSNRTPDEAGMFASYVTQSCDIEVTKALPREEKRRVSNMLSIGEADSTMISDDFQPSGQTKQKAVVAMVPQEVVNSPDEVLKFISHQKSRGKLSCDWQAEFLKWLITAKVFSANRGKNNATNKSNPAEHETALEKVNRDAEIYLAELDAEEDESSNGSGLERAG